MRITARNSSVNHETKDKTMTDTTTVHETTFSWGVLIELCKSGMTVMAVDVYNDDTYMIHNQGAGESE